MNKYFLTDVQREFHEMVRRFAEERIAPLAADIDERDEFPAGLFREIGRKFDRYWDVQWFERPLP